MRWLHSCWEELFSCHFNAWKVVKYAFHPVFWVSLSVPGALQESAGVEFPLGTCSRPLERAGCAGPERTSPLHGPDHYLLQYPLACKVCAVPCCIIQ